MTYLHCVARVSSPRFPVMIASWIKRDRERRGAMELKSALRVGVGSRCTAWLAGWQPRRGLQRERPSGPPPRLVAPADDMPPVTWACQARGAPAAAGRSDAVLAAQHVPDVVMYQARGHHRGPV